jgi:hypothetical protein
MAIIATPSRRRIAMAVLLAVATAGALIRHYAPNPSTLRDIGTLLLVMWLPAVGNLIAYLVRKIPRRPARASGFAAGTPFTPHLRVRLQAVDVPAAVLAAIGAQERQCALIVGQQGFTARLEQPVLQALAPAASPAGVALELLRPSVALPQLQAGTVFNLVVHSTAVATGSVA